MKAAVKFLKQCDELDVQVFNVLDESLPSLPFHGNINVVKNCVNVAVKKLPRYVFFKKTWFYRKFSG